MKGLSVILTLVLLFLAVWLPGRLRASGKLPADSANANEVPIFNLAKQPPPDRPARL